MILSKEEKERRKEERKTNRYNKIHRINKNGQLEKKCSVCEEWLLSDTEHFYKNKNGTLDGLTPRCRECAKKEQNQYRVEHIEEQKIRHRKWHIKNRESEIKKKIEYNNEHKAEKQEYAKQWRQSDNGRKIMRYHGRKYSNKAHSITKKEWKNCKDYFSNEYGEWACAYCGLTISKHRESYNQDFHKEHVNPDGRNDLKNCIPSCKRCNTSKHQDSFNDWYNPNNPVYTYERYHKICQWFQYDCKKYITKKKTKGKYTKKKNQYWEDKIPINF